MKKTLIIIIAVFAFISTYSQTEKGKMFMGGSISFNHNTTNYYDTANVLSFKNKYLNLQIIPNFGYFIMDNFAIGGSLNYQLSINSSDNYNPVYSNNNSQNATSTYGVSVFARYYKKIIGDFSFFINGGVNYSYDVRKDTYSNVTQYKYISNDFSFNLRPGLVYFISPKFGLQATFGSLTISNDVNASTSSFSFGLNYYF